MRKANVIGLDKETVGDFAAQLRGELITAADDEYDEARTLYNAMIDKRPALIARRPESSRRRQW